MKHTYIYTRICSYLFIMVFITSCGEQERSNDNRQSDKLASGNQTSTASVNLNDQDNAQIAEYIRNILEDKNGNLWFGTNGYGVAHYDGNSVSYFSHDQGFGGTQITGITEDPQKNLWFATDQGIVKYDWSASAKGEKQFTNYSDQKYFGGQRFWSIFADSKGNIWAGAAKGIFRFLPTGQASDGSQWAAFELPYSEDAGSGDFITNRTSWSVTEDKEGNIWFATNGQGAYEYQPDRQAVDGQSFTQYTEKDGLTDNSVDVILEDRSGNMWLGTRHGGLSRYNGKTFTNYTADNSIGNNEVCAIHEDTKGNIWFSSEGYGVYRYKASKANQPFDSTFGKVMLSNEQLGLTNFSIKEGLGVKAVQTIFEDSAGRLWAGGGGGLYRYDAASEQARFINVTKNGPWE